MPRKDDSDPVGDIKDLQERCDGLQRQLNGLLRLMNITTGMSPDNEQVQKIVSIYFPDKTNEEICGVDAPAPS